MQTVNPNLNERNLQALQDEVSNYLTDSDLEDSKYTPKQIKQTEENKAITQGNNNNIFLNPLHQRINSLKFESDYKTNLNQNLRDKENEIKQLKTDIFQLQETVQTKEIIIKEFENLVNVTKARFTQFEETNQVLKCENEGLKNFLKDYETSIEKYKCQLEAIESNQRSIKLYEEHVSNIECDFNEKESKLSKRYQERESEIRKEYMIEIGKITKELEDTKVLNEKLKYDVSIYKVKSTELQTQIEDKECDYAIELNKKAKEIAKLHEEIHHKNEQLNQLEQNTHHNNIINEKDITTVKDTANSLIISSNVKNDQIASLENSIIDYRHQIEMLTNEIKEIRTQCENKDIIIDQMKNQNEQLNKELSTRENEMIEYDKLKQQEGIDYNNQYNDLLREKSNIAAENEELVDHLSQANAQIRKMNDLITDKYSALEGSLYKQTMKNENMEKKYKAIIKELKVKEKSLCKENRSIKDMMQEKGEYGIKGDKKNNSLYYVYNNSNNCFSNNTSSRLADHSISIGNYNYNTFGNHNNNNNGANLNNSKIEDYYIEDGQKKTLDEFKRLLNKIDERLDLPIKNIH